MSDPLSGQREAINGGAESLLWPSRDSAGDPLPCPVNRGEVYELRTCRITITRVHRLGRQQGWQWRAEFMRTKRIGADRLYLLDKRGGYTDDPRQAMVAGDQDGDWREVSESIGPPLEPEAIAPEVVAELPSTVSATLRFQMERQERRLEWERLPLTERLKRLEAQGGRAAHRELKAIRAQLARGERKAGIDAA